MFLPRTRGAAAKHAAFVAEAGVDVSYDLAAAGLTGPLPPLSKQGKTKLSKFTSDKKLSIENFQHLLADPRNHLS